MYHAQKVVNTLLSLLLGPGHIQPSTTTNGACITVHEQHSVCGWKDAHTVNVSDICN